MGPLDQTVWTEPVEQRKVGRAAPAKETAERILHGSAVLGVCVGGKVESCSHRMMRGSGRTNGGKYGECGPDCEQP